MLIQRLFPMNTPSNSPPSMLLNIDRPAAEPDGPEAVPVEQPAALLPTEIWAAILSHVTAPLSKYLGSPDAVIAAHTGSFYTARKTLISLAHVNRAAHAAALPLLYGTLSIALREQATHDAYQVPPDPDSSDPRESNSPEDSHERCMKLRERLAVVSRIFPGWCRKGGKCSEAHRERDEKIAQVTEVPEVFPFVVVDGTLYLASLAAHEKAQSGGNDEPTMLAAIQQSVASLLLVSGHDDASTAVLDVKIINGLVLIPYPMPLVTALHIHTCMVQLSDWLAMGTDESKWHWNVKLPFVLELPQRQVTRLTLVLGQGNHGDSFPQLLDQLFRTYPYVSKLDVRVRHENAGFNYPHFFPHRLESATLLQYGTNGQVSHPHILLKALDTQPLRHFAMYGDLRSFDPQEWQHLFNHPTLSHLVTDFSWSGIDSSLIPLRAPRIKMWTSNMLVAGFLFGKVYLELPREEQEAVFMALEELTLIVDIWSEDARLGMPGGDSEVSSYIPFHRLGKTLRKLVVAPKLRDQEVWTNILSDVLCDILCMPQLESLHLPNVHPFWDPPFSYNVTCTVSTLEINLELLVTLLDVVTLPNLTSLSIYGDYFSDCESQLTCTLWRRIASAYGSQLIYFASRDIPFCAKYARWLTFPPDSPALPKLKTIRLFTLRGHVDITHLATIAPSLSEVHLDVDHLAGLPTFLMQINELTLLVLPCGTRCPTIFEFLLQSSWKGKVKHFRLGPRDDKGLLGHGESVIGSGGFQHSSSHSDVRDTTDGEEGQEEHVVHPPCCLRRDLTLVLDRDHNLKFWRWLKKVTMASMIKGDIEVLTLVVPKDISEDEYKTVVAVIKKIVTTDFAGWKLRIGMLAGNLDESQEEGMHDDMPEAISAAVAEMKSIKFKSLGPLFAPEVVWIGKVEVDWWRSDWSCC